MEMQQAAFKPRIRRLSRTRFLIESRTKPGIGHQVDVLRLTCSCEAGKHGRRCWHLSWALQAEQWYNRAEATQRGMQQRPTDSPTTLSAPVVVPAAALGPLEQRAGYRALAECFA